VSRPAEKIVFLHSLCRKSSDLPEQKQERNSTGGLADAVALKNTFEKRKIGLKWL